MKAIQLLLLTISLLYSDFTISYLINSEIKQTVYYKDKEHILFKIENNSTVLEKLYIVNSKKYITFKESGIDHIYEIADELSNKSTDNNNSKKLEFSIVNKEDNVTYHGLKAQKWVIRDDSDLEEEVIVTNEPNIYNKLQKTIKALKRILPSDKEQEASIFDMGNGYVLLKSKELEFINHSDKPINLAMYDIDNHLDKKEQEMLSENIDKCFYGVCCGNKFNSSKELHRFLKESKGWKLIGVGECKDSYQNGLESAVFKKSEQYITIEMTSENSVLGKIDSLKHKGVEIVDTNESTIGGFKIKSAYLPNIDATIADITLPNTIISLYSKGRVNLQEVVEATIKFKIVANAPSD